MSVSISRHRFSLKAQILPRGLRVELPDGEIVEMAPIGDRHSACVDWLNHALAARLGDRAILRVQNPIRLGSHSEPEPG